MGDALDDLKEKKNKLTKLKKEDLKRRTKHVSYDEIGTLKDGHCTPKARSIIGECLKMKINYLNKDLR